MIIFVYFNKEWIVDISVNKIKIGVHKFSSKAKAIEYAVQKQKEFEVEHVFVHENDILTEVIDLA